MSSVALLTGSWQVSSFFFARKFFQHLLAHYFITDVTFTRSFSIVLSMFCRKIKLSPTISVSSLLLDLLSAGTICRFSCVTDFCKFSVMYCGVIHSSLTSHPRTVHVGQRHTIRYASHRSRQFHWCEPSTSELRPRLYRACFAPVGTGRIFTPVPTSEDQAQSPHDPFLSRPVVSQPVSFPSPKPFTSIFEINSGALVSQLRGLLAKARGTAADVRRELVAGDDGHRVLMRAFREPSKTKTQPPCLRLKHLQGPRRASTARTDVPANQHDAQHRRRSCTRIFTLEEWYTRQHKIGTIANTETLQSPLLEGNAILVDQIDVLFSSCQNKFIAPLELHCPSHERPTREKVKISSNRLHLFSRKTGSHNGETRNAPRNSLAAPSRNALVAIR